MTNFNEWLAIKITKAVSTVWCAYLFAFIAVLGFPYGAATIAQYVQWLSQTFIQLTMLSIIMVGQELLTKHHTKHNEHLEEILHHVKKKK